MSGEIVTPVGPLLEIIHEGRKHKSAQKSRARAVWAEVLGVEAASPEFIVEMAEMNRTIGKLMVLVSTTTTMTESARKNYLRTLGESLKVFQPPALDPVFEYTLKTLAQHVESLENLDSQLAHLRSPELSEDQVEELRADVDRVLELLAGSDLPPDLARLLRCAV